MANIKSAKKRILTNKRQKGENKYVKSTISTLTKAFRTLLSEGKLAEAKVKLTEVISYVDSACAKGVLHRNNASRKIARLTAAYDKAQAAAAPVAPVKAKAVKEEKVEKAKVEEVKEVKAPAKKTTTKKAATTTEKKPAAKKTTTKKATAKAEEKVEKAPAKKTATKKATTTKKSSK